MSGIRITHGSREGLVRNRGAVIQMNGSGYNKPKPSQHISRIYQGSRVSASSGSSRGYNRSTDLRQTMSQMDHTNLRKLLPFR